MVRSIGMVSVLSITLTPGTIWVEVEKDHLVHGLLNVVTAVLASCRGYNTLGETTAVFTAGAGVVALLRRCKRKDTGETRR